MNTGFYILNDDKTVLPVEPQLWAASFKQTERRVDFKKTDQYLISTVFIGLDYQVDEGYPNIFSTIAMKRGDEYPVAGFSPTWEAAKALHTIFLTGHCHGGQPSKELMEFVNSEIENNKYLTKPKADFDHMPDPFAFHFCEKAEIDIQLIEKSMIMDGDDDHPIIFN